MDEQLRACGNCSHSAGSHGGYGVTTPDGKRPCRVYACGCRAFIPTESFVTLEYSGPVVPKWVAEGVQVQLKKSAELKKYGLRVRGNEYLWGGEEGTIKRTNGEGWWSWRVDFTPHHGSTIEKHLDDELLGLLKRVGKKHDGNPAGKLEGFMRTGWTRASAKAHSSYPNGSHHATGKHGVYVIARFGGSEFQVQLWMHRSTAASLTQPARFVIASGLTSLGGAKAIAEDYERKATTAPTREAWLEDGRNPRPLEGLHTEGHMGSESGRDRFNGLRGEFVEPYYVHDAPDTWDEGGHFTYGRWNRKKDGEWFVPSFTSGSDYSGSLVEKSNFNVLRDEAEKLTEEGKPAFYVELSGGHGTYALAFHVERTPDEIAEQLAALENYPLADEEAHSELEMEAQNEAWDNGVKSDYKRALEKKFGGDANEIDDDKLFDHFEKWRDKANVYWENQSGSDMYIDIERIVKTCDEPPEGFTYEDEEG